MKPASDHISSEKSSNSFALMSREQLGVQMERRMAKVLRALAEYLDLTFGDILDAIVLYALENKPPFSSTTLEQIAQLKEIYGMDYGPQAGHRLVQQRLTSMVEGMGN